MPHPIRPLLAAAALAMAFSANAAKPAKSVAKPAAAPAALAEAELAHNLGPAGEERLQAFVDHFNKAHGGKRGFSRARRESVADEDGSGI